jgi:hypothetical protein
MRTNLVVLLTLTAIAIATLSAAYYCLPGAPVPQQAETVTPALSSPPRLNVGNTPLREERRDQVATPEQQRQLALMHDQIAALEARLRDMEARASEPAQAHPVAPPDTPVANHGTGEAKTQKLSEGGLGQWMDTMLDAGDFDRDATKSLTADMVTSLTEVPGLNLTALQCGERFCRAGVVTDNGKPPNIAQLIGASAFIESGFTVTDPDGRVRVYFTQPGESLSELRSEAQESTFRDMAPHQ